MSNPLDGIRSNAAVIDEAVAESTSRQQSSRRDVILQNITPSHHCVVDKINGIDFYFEPFGVMDLTWFDAHKLQRSTPLQKSLIDGYLVPITREEHDSILHAESMRQRDEALNAVNPKQRRTRKVEVDGKEVDAEVINLSKVDSQSAQDSISSAGQANDPTSFSIAFNRARKEYALSGRNLSAQVFHQMAMDNPGLIKTYLKKEQADLPLQNTVYSGSETKGRFFVAGQQGQVDQWAQPLTQGLKNFQQGELAAQNELYRTAADIDDAFDSDAEETDEGQMAQIIDLNAPDDSDDLSGFGGGNGVRRL